MKRCFLPLVVLAGVTHITPSFAQSAENPATPLATTPLATTPLATTPDLITPNVSAPGTINSNALTSATAPVPLSPTQPLTLSGALDTARIGSFSLGSAQARIAAAQARLRAAGAFSGTTLSVARAFGRDTGGFDEDILLSQIIELGKRGSRVKGARFEREAAQFERAGVENDLAFAVRAAYYDALRADIERDLARDSLQTAQVFQTAAQNQFTAGDVPRANIVRSSIELSRAQAALVAAESARTVSYATIASLLALPDEANPRLGDALQFKVATYDLTALQELAIRARPDLQGARALQSARLAGVEVARAARRPDAFVEARRAGITSYSGIPNGQSLRVGVVIPLLDFGRIGAATGEARAASSEQNAILDQTLRAARLDVATTYQRFVGAQKAVQSFDAGRLAQARELLDMAQIGYERGANSYLELLDAQTIYRNERADYARALAAWNTALADLERAVGGKLP